MRSRPSRIRALTAAGLALAAGLAVAPPGDVIRVRGVAGDTVVSLIPSAAGGLVDADLMARLLGGSLDSIGDGRWKLALYGANLEIREGTPFAAYNGFPLPLLEPTRRIQGAPHVALQLFSEIIPRFGIGILWDRARWEVRLFQSIARRAAPVGPGDAPVSATQVSTAPDPVPTLVEPEPAPRAPPRSATTRSSPSAPSAAATLPPAPLPRATVEAGPAPAGLARRYVVIVDAGHGGVDPGNPGTFVNGRRVREAQLALGIALKLEQELKRLGLDAYLTRRTDTLIARDDRGPIANAHKGDLFISIHTNAANPAWKNGAAVRGFETYFLSTARTEDERRVAAMENDVVRFEAPSLDAPKGDALSFILNDLAQNEHLRESSDLATTIQKHLARVHPGPDRGVKQGGLAVLARAFMPAVLVEVGFGSNKEDATWMASTAGQRAAAEKLAQATLEYLQHYERRTRGGQR